MTAVHWIAIAVAILVTGIAIGSICAAIASWKHDSPRTWFFAGAACVFVSGLVGGWLSLPVQIAPILVASAIPGTPDVHELTHTADRRRNELVGKLGLVLIAVLLPYMAVSGFLIPAQRTATARPTILDKQEVMEGNVNPYGPGRLVRVISYSYQIDGQEHQGTARHNWSDDQLSTAKVCYDPADPDGSHALELSDYQCGSLALQPNG